MVAILPWMTFGKMGRSRALLSGPSQGLTNATVARPSAVDTTGSPCGNESVLFCCPCLEHTWTLKVESRDGGFLGCFAHF